MSARLYYAIALFERISRITIAFKQHGAGTDLRLKRSPVVAANPGSQASYRYSH